MATFTQAPVESMQRSARARLEPVNKPSNVTKERICHLVQQQVNESGKLARQLCQQSGSKEVSSRKILYIVVVDTVFLLYQILLKSAKKMASQEVAMENTLSVSASSAS